MDNDINLIIKDIINKNNKMLHVKDLRLVLDICLSQGISFCIKRKTGGTDKFKLSFLPPAEIESVDYSFNRNIRSCDIRSKIGSKTVAVIGPDGSGKTTLIDAVRASDAGLNFRFKRFKRYFRRVLPYIMRSQDRNDRDQKLLWLIVPVSLITFTFGYLLSFRSRPTLLDRYFYDYLIKKPAEPGLPLKRSGAYKLFTSILPKPAKLVIAICPTSVILKRKQEMTAVAIDDLYDIYLEQVYSSGLDQVLFCNTSLDPCVSSAQLIDFLADT